MSVTFTNWTSRVAIEARVAELRRYHPPFGKAEARTEALKWIWLTWDRHRPRNSTSRTSTSEGPMTSKTLGLDRNEEELFIDTVSDEARKLRRADGFIGHESLTPFIPAHAWIQGQWFRAALGPRFRGDERICCPALIACLQRPARIVVAQPNGLRAQGSRNWIVHSPCRRGIASARPRAIRGR
jgi:hypothetical protein